MAQLNRGSGYELEVEGNWNAIEHCLNMVQEVQSIEKHSSSEQRYRVRVVSQSGTEPGREIATELVRNGIGLYEMRRMQASLEDVFLELTTEEKTVEDSISEEPEQ